MPAGLPSNIRKPADMSDAVLPLRAATVSAAPGQHFSSLQVLRGIAAMLVVLYHASGQAYERVLHVHSQGPFRFSAAGVDIFFPISGFIIYLAALALRHRVQAWRVFIVRRVIRVAPLYWLVTAVKLAAVLSVPALVLHTSTGLQHVITSFLFIPDNDGEGHPFPILQQGWTLSFEMTFYALLALLLYLGRASAAVLLTVLCVIGAIGLATHGHRVWAPIDLLVSPLQFEFAGGILAAHLLSRGLTLRPAVSMLLIAAAVGVLLFSNRWDIETQLPLRVMVWGVAGFCLLIGMLCLENVVPFARWRWPVLVGNASYSTYLIHTLVIPVVVTVVVHLRLAVPWTMSLIILFSLLLGLLGGIVLHLVVEKPLIRVLNRGVGMAPPKQATLNP